MIQRASGILLHPTSLANAYPIGDLGRAAIAFADFLVESGQRWWQMLPIGPTGEGNSPYQSPSAFVGKPLVVSGLKDGELTLKLALTLRGITATYGRLSVGKPMRVPRSQEGDSSQPATRFSGDQERGPSQSPR